MSPIEDVASYLIIQKEKVAIELIDSILEELNIKDIDEKQVEAGKIIYADLVELMAKSLIQDPKEVFTEVTRWGSDLAQQSVNRGEKLVESLAVLPSVRSAFIRYIGQTCQRNEVSVGEMLLIIEKINFTLDLTINESIKAHDALKESIIETARKEAVKLSAPIVPIHNGVAVLPLVGIFDKHRAEYISNEVIPEMSTLNLNYLIIDLSGIRTIDEMLMDHLIKIHNVLRLIGIHAILTGIRPALAQVAISAGLDFSEIETYLNVQQALERLSVAK